MTKELRKRMGEAAVKAAKAVNMKCGTVEFLVDKDRNFYFMGETRIQELFSNKRSLIMI